MRISDWSSDVCSSDLRGAGLCRDVDDDAGVGQRLYVQLCRAGRDHRLGDRVEPDPRIFAGGVDGGGRVVGLCLAAARRSEEHTSELQSLMRISYAVFCLKKKKPQNHTHTHTRIHSKII